MAGDLSTSIVIGAALSGSFNTVMGRTMTQLERLDKTIQRTQEQSGQIQSFRKLQAGLAETQAAYHKARDRVAQLHMEMQRAGKVTQRMRSALSAARKEAHQLNQRLDQQRQALAKQRLAMRDAGTATTDLDGQQARLGRTVERLSQRYEKLGKAISRRNSVMQHRAALRGQMMDAVALGAAIAAPVRAAMQFESAMADVKKVVDFDTPAQFQAMRKDILQLSTAIPMSAEGLGDIAAAAGQAGIARDELMRFSADAAKMGVAFDMAGKQAGSAMTGLRSIFQLDQNQVLLLGDAYNHLSNNMDATARDMLGIANRVGSTAQLFGLSGQQVGALGATFLALKTSPEVAATGINALLTRLKTADRQGSKFQETLESIGMDAGLLKEQIEHDAQGALLQFLETVKTAEDPMGILTDLFGAEYSDDMAKLVGGLDLYRKALGLVGDRTRYAGSMQKEYEERAKTTANNLQLLQNSFGRLGVTLGSVVLPTLNSMFNFLGGAANRLADFSAAFPNLTKVVVGLAVGLIGAKVAAIGVGYALTFIKGGILSGAIAWRSLQVAVTLANVRLRAFNVAALVTGVRTRALAVGGAIRGFGASLLGLARRAIPAAIAGLRMLGIAAMTNPIGLVIGAIAVAAGLLYYYWEPISGFFKNLWGKILEVFSQAWEGIKSLFLNYHPVGLVIQHWEPISGFFKNLWGKTLEVFSQAWEGIKSLFLNYHPVGLIIQHWEPISGFFKGLWQGVRDWLGSFSLVESGKAIFDGVGAVLASFNPLKSVSAAWNAVTTWLGSFSLVESGKAIIQSVADGIVAMKGELIKAVKTPLGFVGKLLPFSDAKEGPLSRLTASGRAIVETLGQGLRRAGPKPLTQPLTRTLGAAAAGLAVALPVPVLSSPPSLAETRESRPLAVLDPSSRTAAPAFVPGAQAAAGYTVHHHRHGETHITVTIRQLPGEDAHALADRVLEEMERRQAQQRREALHDGF